MSGRNDLQQISDKLDEAIEQITLLRIDVAELRVKSGVWGFAAGAIPALIFFVTKLFMKN